MAKAEALHKISSKGRIEASRDMANRFALSRRRVVPGFKAGKKLKDQVAARRKGLSF